MSLQGSSEGGSHAEITKKAVDLARIYYGTDCVRVELTNELDEGHKIFIKGDTATVFFVFSADWTAEEKHSWIIRTNKPAKCMICKKEKL